MSDVPSRIAEGGAPLACSLYPLDGSARWKPTQQYEAYVPGAICDFPFSDLPGVVNRGVSLIVCGLSERISANSVFHCPSLRRSKAGASNKTVGRGHH
jgi:hypothetical protein